MFVTTQILAEFVFWCIFVAFVELCNTGKTFTEGINGGIDICSAMGKGGETSFKGARG
jgi:hypothetical protein